MTPKLGMKSIRQAQVIAAATRCIARGGIGNLTMQAIADEAGVSKGVVNHYFANKQDVLLQTFQSIIDEYDERLRAGMTADMSPPDFLNLVIAAMFDDQAFAENHLERVFVHFWAECLLDPRFQAAMKGMIQRYEMATRTVIEAGIELGMFRAGDVDQIAQGFLALMDGLTLQYALNLDLFDLTKARAICAGYLKATLLDIA
ncbi:MAG: TetR family transcriptional regulator C-terminal domain-containing protein [Chloroflexi bacterium]|nr:TetR family transcriptional regulator C-terminal domain-containing protein [Chloroflexota bacterium]MBU1747710.1 TetR family transcriptional regulator C-terminal domain-containing protein [Chloroflexota bacterium]